MSDWTNILNLDCLEYKEEAFNENYRCRTASMAKEMGATKLGFHAEILPPKAFSCPYHFHHSEEELFIVLEGKAILRQTNKFREVAKGDVILFRNGPEGAHQFYNHTTNPFKFFALSTKDPLEICEYPDSQKISVNKIKKVFQAGNTVEYFKDEEDPKIYWPKERL